MSNPDNGRKHGTHFAADVSLESVIGKKVTVQPDDCWIWNGRTSRHGYGFHAKAGYVHRFVWSVLKGEIPDDMHVHHVCRVKPCCNPDHLELMTAADHAAHHAEERRAS